MCQGLDGLALLAHSSTKWEDREAQRSAPALGRRTVKAGAVCVPGICSGWQSLALPCSFIDLGSQPVGQHWESLDV